MARLFFFSSSRAEFDCLIDSTREIAERTLEKGLSLFWDRSPNLESYVQELSHKMDTFLQKTQAAHCYYANFVDRLTELETCQYGFENFSGKLADLQTVTRESLDTFSDDHSAVQHWLHKVNTMIGDILHRRLLVAIQLWTHTISQPYK
jgi:hypothetical protein